MATLKDSALQAGGVQGQNHVASRMFWSLWTLRRVQHQMSRSVGEIGSARLAVATILESANALMSAEVHGASGDDESADECTKIARQGLHEALGIITDDAD